jgi:hypothetical protein
MILNIVNRFPVFGISHQTNRAFQSLQTYRAFRAAQVAQIGGLNNKGKWFSPDKISSGEA